MNRNFAFIQYLDEQSAQKAITEENGKLYFGKKLDVQFARAPQNDGSNKPAESPDTGRDRSPLRGNDRFEPKFGGGGGGGGMGWGGGRGGNDGRVGFRSNETDSPRDFMGGMRGGWGGRGGGNSFRSPMQGDRDNFGGTRGPGNGGGTGTGAGGGGGGVGGVGGGGAGVPGIAGAPPAEQPPPFRAGSDAGGGPPPFRAGADMRDPTPPFRGPQQLRPPTQQPGILSTPISERVNDIEIIVLNKAFTEYGEFIERRLKALGFTVDVLFPNEEVPIGRVLGNIASRGTLYSVIVSNIHQQHRSLTLHILHGLPQEHRNMPVEDALTLISRNFDSYIRQCKEKRGKNSMPPENIRHLIEQILSGKELTGPQYEKLIQFFAQEKQRVDPSSIVGQYFKYFIIFLAWKFFLKIAGVSEMSEKFGLNRNR
ncbi:hypothetical protein AAG570_013605 [Ranatra chinensis]|uniref:RRM domain-containing protein n=1 Tax=Ranatra chinensis TaxID=642074 RepID=A0ABD0YV68_9HEMI